MLSFPFPLWVWAAKRTEGGGRVCRDGVHFPGGILPPDAYSARGWGGHVVLVVPSRDLVVVHRAQAEAKPFRTMGKFALGRILGAVVAAVVA